MNILQLLWLYIAAFSEISKEDFRAQLTEHDGEEEREGDDGEDGGIGLAVAGDTVRIDQFLQEFDPFDRI